MKNNSKYIKAVQVLAIFLILSACNKHVDVRESCVNNYATKPNEALLIAEYLQKNGDPVNCKTICNVTAKELYHNLSNNYYVLDMRSQALYDAGHIPGAVFKPMRKLYFHFHETIKPFSYKKIILVCKTGQEATYATSLLRMLGYNNVFALKWGMASWNKETAQAWLNKTNAIANEQVYEVYYNHSKNIDYPVIETGKKWRRDILNKRVKFLLAAGYKTKSIEFNKLNLSDTDNFIIAYCDNLTYEGGHLKNAVHFPIKESLKINKQLFTIPVSKSVIVYSANGFESAYATAYLNVLGYNAKSLLFGLPNKKQMAGTFQISKVPNYTIVKTELVVEETVHEESGGC